MVEVVSGNALQILESSENAMSPYDLLEKLKTDFNIEIARPTLYGYMGPLFNSGKVKKTYKKLTEGSGRSSVFFGIEKK